MKQINTLLNIILLVAVAALFVLHFTSEKSAEGTDSGLVSPTNGEVSIAYLDIDSLISKYDMYNDLLSELQGKVKAIENDINKQGRALENDVRSFQEKMQKGLLTRSQAENMSNDLTRRDQELQVYAQTKQQEMQEEEAVMLNKVMDAIQTYIDSYNSDGRYSLIFTTSATTKAIISGHRGLNITNEIVNGLNQEYIKQRNRK